MYRNHNTHCTNQILCGKLLSKLQIVEEKCDRITIELSEVKQLIKSLPPGIDVLITSIERSANEMHEQSVIHRRFVEQSIKGERPTIHLLRRVDNGL